MIQNQTTIKTASPIGIYDEKGKLRSGFYEPGSSQFDTKYGFRFHNNTGRREDRTHREARVSNNQQARAQGQKDGKPADGLSGGKGNSSKSIKH